MPLIPSCVVRSDVQGYMVTDSDSLSLQFHFQSTRLFHDEDQSVESVIAGNVFGCGRSSNGSIRLPRCSLRDRFDFRLISELGCTTGILSSWYSVHSSLWGKSQFEVAASIIRRLQNTISWTCSEAECPRFRSPSHAPIDVVGKVPVRSCR